MTPQITQEAIKLFLAILGMIAIMCLLIKNMFLKDEIKTLKQEVEELKEENYYEP